MVVYIAQHGIRYEGLNVIGVFDTEDKAKAKCEAEEAHQRDNWDEPWVKMTKGWSRECNGYQVYLVEPYDVK